MNSTERVRELQNELAEYSYYYVEFKLHTSSYKWRWQGWAKNKGEAYYIAIQDAQATWFSDIKLKLDDPIEPQEVKRFKIREKGELPDGMEKALIIIGGAIIGAIPIVCALVQYINSK